MIKFKRNYQSEKEKKKREQIFLANIEKIQYLKEKGVDAEVNKFSDRTEE